MNIDQKKQRQRKDKRMIIIRRPSAGAVVVVLILFLSSQISLAIGRRPYAAIDVLCIVEDLKRAIETAGPAEEIAPEFLDFLILYLDSIDDVAKALEYAIRARQYNIKEYREVALNLLGTSDKLLTRSIKQHGKMMDTWKRRGIFPEHDGRSIPDLRERQQFDRIREGLVEEMDDLMEYKVIREAVLHQSDVKIRIAAEIGSLALQESIHQDLKDITEALAEIKTIIATEMEDEEEEKPNWTHWHSFATGITVGCVATVSIVTVCTGTAPAVSIGSFLVGVIAATSLF